MRSRDKDFSVQQGNKNSFGVDLQDTVEIDQSTIRVELASEFGLTLPDVGKLKKQMERS